MRAGLCALLAFLDDEPLTGRLVLVETLGAGARALERRRRVLDQVIAAVDEGRRVAHGAGPPPLSAEGVVGAVCSILHARLLAPRRESLVALANPLMSMVVLPYLGTAAARAELRRPAPRARPKAAALESDGDLLKELGIRITYRTLRVLQSVGSNPGAGNRQIGEDAGISDQGQISKLLHRLRRLELVENGSGPVEPGGPNAWRLTPRGEELRRIFG
jgi:DNA-binding MarR family transcriptional regulator